MNIYRLLTRISAYGFLFLLLPTSTLYASPIYDFGVVPQFQTDRIIKVWGPILNHLSKHINAEFRLAGSSSIPAFEREFLAGKFDFAYMNPYHFLKALNSQGYIPIVRDHGRKLYGIVVVRKDSKIHSLPELANHALVFPAPNALGASMLPRAYLTRELKIPFQAVYVRSHSSVYLNVALGRYPAGGGVQKTLLQQPAKIRDSLRIIHKSVPFNPHPLAAHPRVPKEVVNGVRRVLLAWGETEEGKEALFRIPINEIGLATVTDYQSLRNLDLEEFYVNE